MRNGDQLSFPNSSLMTHHSLLLFFGAQHTSILPLYSITEGSLNLIELILRQLTR
jgi:hypothetical protein